MASIATQPAATEKIVTKAKIEPLYGIQHLRFIAALMVVFHHSVDRTNLIHGKDSIPTWSVGAAGVDIFFVISGYIMILITHDNPPTPASFFRRRVLRIVPLYWICTLTAFTLLHVAPFMYHGPTAINFLVSSLLFFPAPRSSVTDIVPLIPPGWTLNLEMLFYAFLAIALAFGRLYVLFTFLIALTFFSICLYAKEMSYFFKFYSSYNGIFLEFSIGALLGLAMHDRHDDKRTPLLGIALVVLGFVLLTALWSKYGSSNRLVTAGFPSFVIVAGCLLSEPIWRRFGRSLSILGDASYAIYLTHMFFIIPTVRLALPHKAFLAVNVSPIITQLVFLAGATILGLLVHLFIEKPIAKRLH